MIIRNGNIIKDREIFKADIKVSNGKIIELGENLSDDEVIDADGMYVCPGCVDIHTHGGGGGDFMDADDEAFVNALDFHCKNGTTSLLATSVTAPVERIENMLGVVRRYMKTEQSNCRVLGAHIEGPYLSLKNKGAQHESYLRIPARDPYDFILRNKDVIKTVTIAPEIDGAAEMIAKLTGNDIVVCGGHDAAEKESIIPAIEAGLSHCTHLWCAMSAAVVRENIRRPGLLEMGLSDDRLTVEIIADNHHMSPEMVRIVYKCKGPEKMCIVSDSLRAGGMPEDGKQYLLGAKYDENAQRFIVSDGVACLPDKSRLAGSIQPLSQMVKNMVFDAKIPLVDAFEIASLTPAKVIGEDNKIGSLHPGKMADICILDKNLDVKMTILSSRIVYKRERI